MDTCPHATQPHPLPIHSKLGVPGTGLRARFCRFRKGSFYVRPLDAPAGLRHGAGARAVPTLPAKRRQTFHQAKRFRKFSISAPNPALWFQSNQEIKRLQFIWVSKTQNSWPEKCPLIFIPLIYTCNSVLTNNALYWHNTLYCRNLDPILGSQPLDCVQCNIRVRDVCQVPTRSAHRARRDAGKRAASRGGTSPVREFLGGTPLSLRTEGSGRAS